MHRAGQRGFTLVEAIVVIVLIGIVGGMVGVFITVPLIGYQDSVARAELSDIADLALRRMARDVRLALPNSIRVSGSTIEFLQTKAGGRYLAAEDGVSGPSPLDFVDTTKSTFAVLSELPTGKQAIVPNSDYFVVNNLDLDGVRAYDYANGALKRNIAKITGVAAGTGASAGFQLITLENNPFAAQVPPMPSPSARFQVVSGPVTYHCVPSTTATSGDGSLSRQWNYGITEAQAAPPVAVGTRAAFNQPQSSYIAKHIKSCSFEYTTVASTRTALLRMTLVLYAPETGDVSLSHQIHVDNTP